jgi:hypothetical protein
MRYQVMPNHHQLVMGDVDADQEPSTCGCCKSLPSNYYYYVQYPNNTATHAHYICRKCMLASIETLLRGITV